MNPRTALPTCARCGAPVSVATGDTRAQCGYCGARLLVDASERTREAKKIDVAAMPPQAVWVVSGALALLTFSGALAAYLARVPPRVPATEPVAPVPEPVVPAEVAPPVTAAEVATVGPSSLRAGWLLGDVDGDGVDDVIGVFAHAPAEGTFLGAISGADGHELWRADASVAGADPETSFRALLDADLLVGDVSGVLHDLDPHTGAVRWARPLGAPARDLCGTSTPLHLRTRDGATHRIALDTGNAEATDAPRACEHAYTSSAEGPNFTTADRQDAARLTSAAAGKVIVYHALLPVVGSARVAIGADRQGRGPALAVVADGAMLWSALLAPRGVTGLAPLQPMRATVRFNRVVATYGARGSGTEALHVACLDLATGRRLWDYAPPETAGPTTEVAISRDRRVFLRTVAGRLRILDLENGAERMKIGGT